MDKEALTSRLRLPLSSIGNLSKPASDEQILRDNDYDVYAPDLVENGKDAIPLEYVTGRQSPQIQIAQRVYLTPLSRLKGEDISEDHRRSRSMDVHFPTQLEPIEEAPLRASSLRRIRHSKLQSSDDRPFSLRVLQTTPQKKTVNRLPPVNQKPKEPSQDSPEGKPRLFEIPKNNTAGTKQYPIPLPPPALRERLNDRPSPDQLLQERCNSRTSNDTFRRADNGRLSREIWRVPRSDEISIAHSNGHSMEHTRPLNLDAFDSESTRLVEPISGELSHPGLQSHNEETPRRDRWKRA